MTITMSSPDLQTLAKQSGKFVHGLDFPDQENYQEQKALLIELLDVLSEKYTSNTLNSELIFDAQAALLRRPVDKTAIYVIVRDIMRVARGGDTPCKSDRSEFATVGTLTNQSAPVAGHQAAL